MLTGLIAAAMLIPWLWRNAQVYGSLTAMEVANIPVVWRSAPDAAYAIFTYIQDSFWAVSGIYNQVNVLYPNIGRGVSLVAGIGWGATFITRREVIQALVSRLSPVHFGMAFGVLMNVGLVVMFGVQYGQGQGRFLYPMLLPIALILARGLQFLPIAQRETIDVHVVGAFAAYVISFAALSLAIFPRG
jgi:hypothetical protein